MANIGSLLGPVGEAKATDVASTGLNAVGGDKSQWLSSDISVVEREMSVGESVGGCRPQLDTNPNSVTSVAGQPVFSTSLTEFPYAKDVIYEDVDAVVAGFDSVCERRDGCKRNYGVV